MEHTARLIVDGKTFEIPILRGTKGERALDISSMVNVLRAMGIPLNIFTVMFAIGRLQDWIRQWKESIDDRDWKLQRHRQLYLGPELRDYVPMYKRGK
ncbi:MAG: citrate/2-methylcitrate synthase [Desulfobacteraceae bacterium]